MYELAIKVMLYYHLCCVGVAHHCYPPLHSSLSPSNPASAAPTVLIPDFFSPARPSPPTPPRSPTAANPASSTSSQPHTTTTPPNSRPSTPATDSILSPSIPSPVILPRALPPAVPRAFVPPPIYLPGQNSVTSPISSPSPSGVVSRAGITSPSPPSSPASQHSMNEPLNWGTGGGLTSPRTAAASNLLDEAAPPPQSPMSTTSRRVSQQSLSISRRPSVTSVASLDSVDSLATHVTQASQAPSINMSIASNWSAATPQPAIINSITSAAQADLWAYLQSFSFGELSPAKLHAHHAASACFWRTFSQRFAPEVVREAILGVIPLDLEIIQALAEIVKHQQANEMSGIDADGNSAPYAVHMDMNRPISVFRSPSKNKSRK
eukprot:TRINITY_DN8471_c0_g1_i1.p1 TRINITY_DN8471_c0_g1~~TRINITY_DN8471_c0_g1_i1.p1  ORF type:complete len:379 (+),score=64.25 TRINITY_DN8471_c0_g1_i1:380-1516(+)